MLDALQRIEIERACEALVFDFAHFVDHRRFEELAQLFAEDATFTRPRSPDQVIEGRESILASFQTRPAHEMTRHLISNVRTRALSNTQAEGSFYLVLHAAEVDESSPAGPFGRPTDGRALIADIQDRYVRTPSGWRIAQRRGRILMHT